MNRDGAAVLAAQAANANLPLIYISTDYVFDGSARVPYDEEHEVNPQGAYARSKEAGERAVRANLGKHLILRTAWVYGPFGTNFVKTMLRLGAERDEIRVVDDQTGRPTSTGDLAEAILAIAEAAQRSRLRPVGHLHYAGADTVTWHGFATMIFAEAETFGRKVPPCSRSPPPSFPRQRRGPAYSVLSTAKSNAASASSHGRFAPASRRR